MSPELETLDQLQGEDLPLQAVRSIFGDNDAFRTGLLGLLSNGDVLLFDGNDEVPRWRWRESLKSQSSKLIVKATEQGSRRME